MFNAAMYFVAMLYEYFHRVSLWCDFVSVHFSLARHNSQQGI